MRRSVPGAEAWKELSVQTRGVRSREGVRRIRRKQSDSAVLSNHVLLPWYKPSSLHQVKIHLSYHIL